MKEFDELLDVLKRLLGPDGCPWDREQTMQTMRASLLEETCETIDAINLDHNLEMEEELGDLFFNVVFMCLLAQKEHRFNIQDVLKHVTAKLIHRHPHVFGETKIENAEQVIKQWDEIKKRERAQQSVLDHIPKSLPSLARAQKVYKKIKKTPFTLPDISQQANDAEQELGKAFFDLMIKGHEKDLDAEQSLRKYLANLEDEFRSKEPDF